MSDNHSHHDITKHVRGYIFVFVALLIGTALTVWVSHFHFGSEKSNVGNIVVALIIASVKAFLVAGYFMHLISEKKMIYSILGFTGFFVAGLVFLTLWSMNPNSIIHFK
ncbi:MAG: cytochrome C oxidase subunit IV family protein [Verrucomicrobiota bacterium]